jgi:hypothetical protein
LRRQSDREQRREHRERKIAEFTQQRALEDHFAMSPRPEKPSNLMKARAPLF